MIPLPALPSRHTIVPDRHPFAFLGIAVALLLGAVTASRAARPPVWAQHLPAQVQAAAKLAPGENQRAPFGWTLAPVTTAEQPATILQWPELPPGARPTHLRIAVGLDERDEKEVLVSLAKSGRALGRMELRFVAQFQVYQLALQPADVAEIQREGVTLQLTKGSDLEIFSGGDGVPAALLPHLLVPGTASSMEEFFQRLRSLAVVQQFGWMEGCVLEGLLDLAERPGGEPYRKSAEQHLGLFIRDGKLVYETPRSTPGDGRIYGIEATLPFATLARLRPHDPLLELPVHAWDLKRRPGGAIQDGSTISSEGAYTVGYPMALIARARGDEAMMRDALEQCRLRQAAFFDGKEFWRTRDEAGMRHDRNWARGIAWQMLGLVRTLEVGKDRADIQELVAGLQELSRWVMEHQRDDGLWSVIVTEPKLTADTSGSAGIAAALARAARLGWIDTAARESARRTSAALQRQLTADGFLDGASQSNKGGLGLQRSDYRVIFQMGMGLLAQLVAALEEASLAEAAQPSAPDLAPPAPQTEAGARRPRKN